MNLRDEKIGHQLEINHNKILRRALKMTRSYDKALDLAAEARLRAWKFRHKFEDDLGHCNPGEIHVGFLTWETKILININIDNNTGLKAKAIFVPIESDDSQFFAIEPSQHISMEQAHTEAEQNQDKAQLQSFINALLPSQRDAVSLSISGETYQEAANKLECTVSAYKARLFRAHRELKNMAGPLRVTPNPSQLRQ
jgi:RNA polymerase sigma factor (sigma-70 family)